MSNLVARLFDPLFRRWMASRLRVHVAGLSQDPAPDQPLVYCANHLSWWDGFLVRQLHQQIRPGAPFRAVMLDRELQSRGILKALGGLGIEPGSLASGRRLLRTVKALPRDAGVAFFPQGRLRPQDPRPLGFRSGISRVIRALSPAVVLPIGIRLLPGKDHRVDAFVSVGTALPALASDSPNTGQLERAVTRELEAIRAFVERFEEDAAQMWPTAAGLLPRNPGALWSGPAALPFSKN